MAKAKSVFACQNCGYQSSKWLGKCPDCNQWNTFAEEHFEKATSTRERVEPRQQEEPTSIDEIDTAEEGRVLSGIGEFDRVLGGGVVPGSLVLIGGDPGIGKSTLAAAGLSPRSPDRTTCLYVSGEESPRQIKMRAERLGVAAPKLLVLAETDAGSASSTTCKKLEPAAAGRSTRSRRCSPRRARVGARQRRPGARVRRPADACWPSDRTADLPGRPRHQGRRHRRAARARAHGRHRALLRGRARPRLTASCAR